MTWRIGVPENRQNAWNPPLLSSALLTDMLDNKMVAIMSERIGVVDMSIDLDESRGKSRENLPAALLLSWAARKVIAIVWLNWPESTSLACHC